MRPPLNKILIIDDNKNDLELAQHYLNKEFDGLMFVLAQSGKDFDERISWLMPDLIISDFDLPDCTGLDILIKVRKTSDIPFIFMSGTLDDNVDTLSKTILNGANGYVLKDRLKKLPAIVDYVMEKAYVKRSVEQESEEEFNRIKLKLAKSIELLKMGAPTDSVILNLEEVKAALNNVK